MNFSFNKVEADFFDIVLILKNSSYKTFYSLLLFVFSAFASTNLFAAAGDTITATATVNYDIAGAPGSSSASASFLEDRLINFFVTDSNGGSAVPVISDMNDAVLQFTVTNTGNVTQDFLLTALNTTPNPYGTPLDNFDPLTIQVFVESGATPGYQPAEDSAAFIDELTVSASQIVYVVADMPTQNFGDVAAIALVAQIAEDGAAGVEGAAINADDNGHTSPAGVFSNGSTSMSAGTANTIPDSPATMETVFNDPAGLRVKSVNVNSFVQIG